jgi:hypothetical protein
MEPYWIQLLRVIWRNTYRFQLGKVKQRQDVFLKCKCIIQFLSTCRCWSRSLPIKIFRKVWKLQMHRCFKFFKFAWMGANLYFLKFFFIYFCFTTEVLWLPLWSKQFNFQPLRLCQVTLAVMFEVWCSGHHLFENYTCIDFLSFFKFSWAREWTSISKSFC